MIGQQAKPQVRLTPEAHQRVTMHSKATGDSAAEIASQLILEHVPAYKRTGVAKSQKGRKNK